MENHHNFPTLPECCHNFLQVPRMLSNFTAQCKSKLDSTSSKESPYYLWLSVTPYSTISIFFHAMQRGILEFDDKSSSLPTPLSTVYSRSPANNQHISSLHNDRSIPPQSMRDCFPMFSAMSPNDSIVHQVSDFSSYLVI